MGQSCNGCNIQGRCLFEEIQMLLTEIWLRFLSMVLVYHFENLWLKGYIM